MRTFTTIASLKKYIAEQKQNGASIGFVPTMGALHAGHISLIARALQECSVVICSVFVNPTQFNNAADLQKYPRTLETDTALLAQNGCTAVFAPSADEMYPNDNTTILAFDLGTLDTVMEGESRPGHFAGVTTVVDKLFNAVQPNIAYFGQKDFQQLAVINAMTKVLHPTIKIVGCAIVREVDGLAMSSRNTRLNEHWRRESVQIFKILTHAKQLATKGIEPSVIIKIAIENFSHTQLQLDYFEIVNANTLLPATNYTQPCVLCVAAYAGDVRLIDNMRVE
ncbi:MAG: pantoate--beta-alanine ligase [Bacteroidia bacterium]|nr:pantoate--beta-alanine ligase [Bacteroidia bacterium]